MSDYWFARRYPIGDPRNAVGPVTREGRLVALAFVAAMAAGAVVFAVMAIAGEFILGAATFAVIAGLGGGGFIIAAQQKLDRNHTVEDYRTGRVQSR
ncbi:MAG: hypothetical protein AB7O56_15350 [Bauldia sp.]